MRRCQNKREYENVLKANSNSSRLYGCVDVYTHIYNMDVHMYCVDIYTYTHIILYKDILSVLKRLMKSKL